MRGHLPDDWSINLQHNPLASLILQEDKKVHIEMESVRLRVGVRDQLFGKQNFAN